MSRELTVEHEHLGGVIRYLRRRAGLHQNELSELMKNQGNRLGTAWLSRIERGQAWPSKMLLSKTLATLSSSPEEFETLLQLEPDELQKLAEQDVFNASLPNLSPTWSADVGTSVQAVSSTRSLAANSSQPMLRGMHQSSLPVAEAASRFISAYSSADATRKAELLASLDPKSKK